MRVQLLHEIIEELKSKLEVENTKYNELLSSDTNVKAIDNQSKKIEKIKADLNIFQQEHDTLLQAELKFLSSRSLMH
jgi:hypothetical protein